MLKKAQAEDPIIREAKKWVESGNRPDTIQALRAPADLIRLWRTFELLTIHNGLLARKWIFYHKRTRETEVQKKLYIVPEAKRVETMTLAHSNLLSNHPGVEETLGQLRQHFYWPKMHEDVRLFVEACVTCGRAKQPQAYLRAPLKHVIANEFNDVLVIDHIVPERDVVTKRGNRYILSITDLFTGYLMALPAKTKTSEETIRLINGHWCAWKGYPKEIIADNDPGFTSKFYNAVLHAFEIKPTHGTPYKCSSTSKGERSNKRINNALRLMLDDRQIRDWDLYLKWVCSVCNSTKSRHTGFSANRLVFGRELNTPQSILLNDPCPGVETQNPSAHAVKANALHWTLKTLIRRARQNGAADFLSADNWYNKHLHGPFFKEGDWCFILENCPAHKFSKRWRGPYRIVKVVSEHVYYVDVNGTDKLLNISKLKHYKKNAYSPKGLDPTTPAFKPSESEPLKPRPTEDVRPTIELELVPIPVAESPNNSSNLIAENAMQLQGEQPLPNVSPTVNSDLTAVQDTAVENLLTDATDEQPTVEHQLTSRRYPLRERRPVSLYQAGLR